MCGWQAGHIEARRQRDDTGATTGRGRSEVRAFLHDELVQTLPAEYDREGLLSARRATYVIHQDVAYTYSTPIRDLRQRLVVLPKRRHLDQVRVADRFDVRHAQATGVSRRTDRFRNSVLRLHVPAVVERVEFRFRAVLERSTHTEHRDQPWPSTTTPLTTPDRELAEAAADLRHPEVAETVAAISSFVRGSFEYCHDVTSVRTTAVQAWAARRGVCQDMAHVMLAMCASIGLPARYVSGHMVGDGASHAWVEVFDHQRERTISIDPTHDRLTDLRYLTTAVGRDYRDVAPTSGTYVSSGGRGRLEVRKAIRVAQLS